MIILGIETTSSAVSVALLDSEKLMGEYIVNTKLSHLEKLMPMIHSLLEKCEIQFDEVQGIAISEGPGSFTGIRIGFSAAKALAQVKNIPMVGVPTLKALAYNYRDGEGIIVPILDARRNQVYGGAYRWEDGKLMECVTGKAMAIDELIEEIQLKTTHEKIIFLGDGVKPYSEYILKHLGSRARFASPFNCTQRASSIAQLGYEMMQEGKTQDYKNIKPNYMRKSEAERNSENKQKSQKNKGYRP
ncbi:MAG: tRNA (adenosine(37)-N6)-threonylcarbamoyltransferase complex dimerization subunit type 1 TsaB [Peptostreptococcales bacterium]